MWLANWVGVHRGSSAIAGSEGDLDHARTLHERALSIRETVLGPDHPETATSLSNLATVLRMLGDLDTSRTMHERVAAR